MNINNEIPREVEISIRKLRNNDALVSEVWAILSAYREIHNFETEAPDLEAAKKSIDKVFRYLDKYTEAVNEVSRYGFYSLSKLDNYLDEIREYWAANREQLENRDGRKTKQESLLWLVENLLRIFNTWGISERKLTGFVVFVTPFILPDGTAPSRSSIQSAKNAYSN